MPNEADAGALTTEDLCTLLQVSRPVVQQLLRSGSLPGVQLSRRDGWRVTQVDFDAWVHDQHTDTRAWIRANPSPAAGMWDPDTGGPTT